MTINRLIVAFCLVFALALGVDAGQVNDAHAQKVKTSGKSAKPVPGAKTAKAKATAKTKLGGKVTAHSQGKTGTVKVKTGFFAPKTAKTKVKTGETLHGKTAKAAKPAKAKKLNTRAKLGTEVPGATAAPSEATSNDTATTAAKTEKRLTASERKEAKAKEKAKNSIIPERKTPIHQKLEDPNFFGEKDDVAVEPNIETMRNSHAALKRLQEPSNLFFSGDVGRLMSARLINRTSRNDADFRYAYGQEGFKNFAKADAILNRIPQGQLSKSFDVALLTEVNKVAFAEGGDSAFTRAGKALRDVFMPKSTSKAGQMRNYQSYHFESKGLSAAEKTNLAEHGARFVKLPLLRSGWIVYAKPKTVKPGLDALIATTRKRLNDPNADPIETASGFVQKFIALHPFADGNGRTARLMMDRILAEKGILPPILKNTGNDIGLSSAEYAKEVLHGVARTGKMLGLNNAYGGGTKDVGNISLHSGAGYVQRMMTQHGHTISGLASQKFAKHDGLSYALGNDGFVYNSAGRPHMADKEGNLRPLGQMTLYILMRRVAQRKNAPDILQQITTPTREAFDNLLNGKPTTKGKKPMVHSDLGAIKSDGKLAVDLEGIDSKMLISLLNPENVSTKTMLTKSHGGSELTTIMSRYQQADLELWYVKEAFGAKGDKTSVAKIEKHRDVLFARARAELRSHVKKGSADDDNPLGAKQEFERIQHEYSPLRFAKRSDYTKKHGDSDAFIFRGENFAKWTGVHIDSAPFRPGLKDAAGMRAKKQGSLNLFDALDQVQRDTVGTGVQSYTTDLALLARKGGFADQHKNISLNLGAMPAWGKALVGLRIKDGEALEVKSNTSLISALFSRKIATQPGHFSVGEIGAKELDALIEQYAPAENAGELSKRASEARSTRKGLLSGLTSLFARSRRQEVKVDDLMSADQLKTFGTALAKARNLVTVRREGDALNVTAHRRANVFKVQKNKMLPGTDALAGSFLAEQEVHVMSTVLPHRILGTFTQGHLSADVGAAAKENSSKTEVKTEAPMTTTKVSAAQPLKATGTL